jgi:hypothetical protein
LQRKRKRERKEVMGRTGKVKNKKNIIITEEKEG